MYERNVLFNWFNKKLAHTTIEGVNAISGYVQISKFSGGRRNVILHDILGKLFFSAYLVLI